MCACPRLDRRECVRVRYPIADPEEAELADLMQEPCGCPCHDKFDDYDRDDDDDAR